MSKLPIYLAVLVTAGCGSSANGQLEGDRILGAGGHQYQILGPATDWLTANSQAIAAGGHLVTITSAEEQQFLSDRFLVGENRLRVFWIGASDHQVENEWRWVTGEPFVYENWKSREPNGWQGPEEDYGCINWNAPRGRFGEWNDTLVEGTRDFDDGANDGPYSAIVEFE